MTAPTRPPHFIDAIAGDAEIEPETAVPWLIEKLVSKANYFPDWVVEDMDIAVQLSVAEASSIAYEANGLRGVITLSRDVSGWLLAVARAGDQEVGRFYIERPYEEYEVWPPASGRAEGEAPGRLSKREAWISLRAEAWPRLAKLANRQGGINISIAEARTA